MNGTPTIVGAGLAGLLAAHAWPTASVLESSGEPRGMHRALLRFRTDAVAKLTGIDFRRVRVRKGLWADNAFRSTDIRYANLYAQKVIGSLAGERSIWSLEPVDRFVAPDDFYEQLLASVGSRVRWSSPADFRCEHTSVPVVSTAPLPLMLSACGIAAPEFRRSPIHVERWRVAGADVFQTVYYPDPDLGLYRCSITGDTLIAESMAPLQEEDRRSISRSFGLRWADCQSMGAVEQKYGKIAPIDDAVRKRLIFRLSHEHGVYPLGRFATWRNILLDDVVDDIQAIKRLLRSSAGAYDLRKANS